LKWRSQETNTKLLTLADHLLEEVGTLKQDDQSLPLRATFDHLLLTAHQRIRAKASENRSRRE
jgi:hypothetical protein